MKNSKKLVIVGFDGSTFELIDKWVEEGKLPGFERLINNGISGTIKSVIPTTSCPAWFCCFTGKNPGRLGAYNYANLKANSYETEIYDFTKLKAESFWDILGDFGKRSAIINVPVTYPAKKINGLMISGTGVSLSKSVYPKEFIKSLPKGYDSANLSPHMGLDNYVKTFLHLHRLREGIFKKLLKENFDLYFIVFTITDYFAHVFWKNYGDQDPKYKDMLLLSYQTADKFVQDLLKDKGIDLMVMSDHSTVKIDGVFYINEWLIQEGYLTPKKIRKSGTFRKVGFTQGKIFKILKSLKINKLTRIIPSKIKQAIPEDKRDTLALSEIQFSKTRAFTSSQNIFVNLKGKRPEGIVKKEEYDTLLDEMIRKLKKLKDPKTGQLLKVECFKNSEIYSGEFAENGPDLAVLINGGRILLSSTINKESLITSGPEYAFFTANHGLDGVFMACGEKFKMGKIKGASLMDIGPTVLKYFNIPIANDVDGRALDIFKEKTDPEKKRKTDLEKDLIGKALNFKF